MTIAMKGKHVVDASKRQKAQRVPIVTTMMKAKKTCVGMTFEKDTSRYTNFFYSKSFAFRCVIFHSVSHPIYHRAKCERRKERVMLP